MLITRRLEFDAGHRIPDHKSQCRQLLGEGQVADVEIQQPSLEDLYCYYMQRAESTAPAGES